MFDQTTDFDCFQKSEWSLNTCIDSNLSSCFPAVLAYANHDAETDEVFSIEIDSKNVQTLFPYVQDQYTEQPMPRDLWVGYEPFEGREQRWTYLTQNKARVRHGLLIDTGAPENAAGEEWIERVTHDQGTSANVTWTPYHSQLHGIGQGAAVCHHKAEIPIGLEPSMNTTFKTQVLSGCGSRVPGLLGLDSLIKRRAIIDLSDASNDQSYHLHFRDSDNKWQTLRIEKVNGHLILPIDNYPTQSNLPMPSKDQFSKDPLGLNTWYCDSNTNETYVVQPNAQDEYLEVSPSAFRPGAPGPIHEHAQYNDNTMPFTTELLATGMSSNPPRTPSGDPAISPSQHNSQLLATGLSSNPPRTPSGDPVVQLTTQHITNNITTQDTNRNNNIAVPEEPAHCQKKNRGEISKNFDNFHDNFQTQHRDLGNSQFRYKNKPDTDTQNIMRGTYSVLKRIKNTAKHLKLLAGSATYQRKYKGLPLGTPVPEIPSKYLDAKQWDFWEWWSGKSGLTAAVAREGLITGPPISHETGWCLKLQSHRKRLMD
jgi:hypothetical protein